VADCPPFFPAGFGLGALNDADEDDLDVYDGGFGGKGGRRLAYDAGEDEDDRITLGPSKRANENKPNEQGAVSIFICIISCLHSSNLIDWYSRAAFS
jgi:hypothetical protein